MLINNNIIVNKLNYKTLKFYPSQLKFYPSQSLIHKIIAVKVFKLLTRRIYNNVYKSHILLKFAEVVLKINLQDTKPYLNIQSLPNYH